MTCCAREPCHCHVAERIIFVSSMIQSPTRSSCFRSYYYVCLYVSFLDISVSLGNCYEDKSSGKKCYSVPQVLCTRKERSKEQSGSNAGFRISPDLPVRKPNMDFRISKLLYRTIYRRNKKDEVPVCLRRGALDRLSVAAEAGRT